MKVNDPSMSGASPGNVGKSGLEKAQQLDAVVRNRYGRETDAGAGHEADQVELSELSAQLRAQSAESPERAAHLERLGAEVAGGRYRVDARELSRRLVEETLRPGQ
jgi:anti-sigma28 factor (negative regulator of flagellin synthesis)